MPLAVAALLFGSSAARGATPVFHDVTLDAGITHTHDYLEESISTRHMFLPGVAASDYDDDGWTDLYVIRGSIGPNLLYRNRGDGTFEDVATAAGVATNGDMGSGALFFDANGDGALDLFVAGIRGTANHLFMSNGDGTFTDGIAASGLPSMMDTYSASAADYDRDGDLDLFLAHWEVPMGASHLWRNNGAGVFTCVDEAAGIRNIGNGRYDYSFTANFCDLDGDRWPDIVMCGDFETSRVFLNRRDGTFADATGVVITDENAMGAAVGDYDNDGDIDWFVSSIYDATEEPNGGAWGFTGNRLYRNRNDGSFDDVTGVAGVREGGWGWGASFADFDNDGWLDLFHVNGWPFEVDTFIEDPARLFMNRGDGTFAEQALDAGCASTGQGRGVVCFDYDRDGDIDIYIANYRGAPQLLRNDTVTENTWISIDLRRRDSDAPAVGAHVRIETGGVVQTREVMCGNNYLSQNPAEIHVGLGMSARVEGVRIEWPNGGSTSLTDLAANQRLVVDEPAPRTPARRPLRVVSAYPNPFVSEVTVTFGGASRTATAVVFDVAGRRVRAFPSATGTVRWDGRDEAGRQVPAGVYWFYLRDGNAFDARRVVLVR